MKPDYLIHVAPALHETFQVEQLRKQLEMCPEDTDAPAVAKYSYSHKVKNDIIILMDKGQQLLKLQDDMDHFRTYASHFGVKLVSKL